MLGGRDAAHGSDSASRSVIVERATERTLTLRRELPSIQSRSGLKATSMIVVEHVVVDELVLAVEPAARSQLLPRRVDRDVAPALPIEQRDVLGFLARSRVGEAAEPRVRTSAMRSPDVGIKRPSLAAQIAQVDVEGLTDELVEDSPRRGGDRRTPPARQRRLGQEVPEL